MLSFNTGREFYHPRLGDQGPLPEIAMFYATQSQSVGVQIFTFATKKERDLWVTSNLHARKATRNDVDEWLKAKGVYVRFGKP